MHMIRAGSLALALAVVLWQAAGGEALRAQDPVAAAEAGARATAATPEGREFARSVGESFGRDHSPTVSRCAKKSQPSDLANFSLFLRVAATGWVEEVLVRPATGLSECVRAKLKGWKVGAPPGTGAWVEVAVNLKPK